jgi:hypothetical protein
MTLKQLVDAYFVTFSSPAGQAVFDNLRAEADAPVDYARPSDGIALALQAAYRNGQQSLLAKIERMVNMSKSGKEPAQEAETE